jgi:hypothetical protein
MMRRGKTGGKKSAKKPPKADKPMSHGDKHKAMMERIKGDPEV